MFFVAVCFCSLNNTMQTSMSPVQSLLWLEYCIELDINVFLLSCSLVLVHTDTTYLQ